ncbi:MAG TPA: glycosyltransferase family 1 protein [Gammaproteobacteria bacterium]|nr:glycosyltransferase family 1 protein [Gammaproteobacteria bacterium]
MKILLIEPGGYAATFQYTHNLANELANRGHTVVLGTGLKFETKEFPRSYTAFEIFDRFFPRPIRLLAFLSHVRKMQPDIIHIQGHSHPTSYLLIRKMISSVCEAKFVYTAQDVIPKQTRKHHRYALKSLYAKALHIFVNAQQNREMLLESFPRTDAGKITVIPLADLTAFVSKDADTPFPGIPEELKIVLFFGNIEPRKGLQVLLESFRSVAKSVPDAFLLIVGKPFEGIDTYLELANNPDIADRLIFHHHYFPLVEIPALFSRVDIVAVPYVEGWNSAVIATAYANGRPVIASDIGGFDEVVDDGNTGLLVPPGDVPALADAITRVLSDSTLYSHMQKNVKEKSKLNSWPEIARKTEEIYLSLAS